jgi:hypothetical protein
MRISTPDLVTNSYFPALAAEELGLFREEGSDAHVELLPSLEAVTALRDGAVDFVAGGAHSMLLGFPNWKGAKLVVTLSQGTPWAARSACGSSGAARRPRRRQRASHRRGRRARSRVPAALARVRRRPA